MSDSQRQDEAAEYPSPQTPSAPIPYACQWIEEDDVRAVDSAVRREFLTQGPTVETFEKAVADLVEARYAVAVSSGTAALHLAVLALGLNPGMVGVTTPMTFAATANAFLYCGAKPVFVDVDPVTGLVDAGALDKQLAELSATGAAPGIVSTVSLAGQVGDLPRLRATCDRYGWRLIEDAAHSLGATYSSGKARHRSGSCAHSDAAILSFHPVKHITTGEGGVVLTNDRTLADRVRLLRSHGIQRTASAADSEGGWFYEQVDLGFNYRLTDLQAALGLSQLTKLDRFVARRRELAQRYRDAFSSEPCRSVFRPAPEVDGHAYHLFVVHFVSGQLRRRAYDFLRERGVYTQVHYIPVYRHPYYRDRFQCPDLPGAEAYYRGCLSLPMFPKMTNDEQGRVISVLADFCETAAT